MKLGVFEGLDEFVNQVVVKKGMNNEVNQFMASCFPQIFGNGNINFLQHLFCIPLPFRNKFVFFVLFAISNTGISKQNKERIIAFGMLDCSGHIPVFKNFCRRNEMYWKGVGEHVLNALEIFALNKKISYLQLTVDNRNLVKYYKRYGWILLDNGCMVKFINIK